MILLTSFVIIDDRELNCDIMKILLAGAPIWRYSKYGRPFFVPYSPPIGIAYITAYLKSEGIEDVHCIDFVFDEWDFVERKLKELKPDVVGLTCLTEQRFSVIRFAQIAKKINPECFVVVGGVHPTFLWKQILENYPEIDCVVLGEGEISFKKIVLALQRNSREEFDGIGGIAYRVNNSIKKTFIDEMIRELDKLPYPYYDEFDLDRYRPYQPPKYKHLKYAPINSSRGCVARCQFCSVPEFWGARWRARSALNIFNELKRYLLANRLFINFTDDLFSTQIQRVIELSKLIIENGVEVYWDFETRVNLVNEEMLKLAAKAGCVSIAYGVESGSEEILENIHKRTHRNQVIEAFQMTKDYGILAHALLMIGNPGENEHTIRQTINLIKLIKPDSVAVQIVTIYPGTELYGLAKSKGFISDEYWLADKPCPFYTLEHSIETLKKWQDKVLWSSELGMKRRIARQFQLLIDRSLGLRITKEGIVLTR